jgi:hypothetical protein
VRHTEDTIRQECSLYTVTYVSGFINTNKPFLCLCSCGNSYNTYLGNIQKGYRCKVCSDNRSRLKHSDIEKELNCLGLKLISDYQTALKPFIYECACGGIGKARIDHVRRGIRCGKCTENNWKKLFLDHGCEIIEYRLSTDITYRCSCSNITTTRAGHWNDGNKTCPKCRTYWNHNENKLTRPTLYLWKKHVLLRDNFCCARCAEDVKLNIHHIEAYSIKPELASEVSNGITLCNDCHKTIHRLYGFNVGRVNLDSFLKM